MNVGCFKLVLIIAAVDFEFSLIRKRFGVIGLADALSVIGGFMISPPIKYVEWWFFERLALSVPINW